ncbi:MAG: bifunctional phosphoserine phosphatase/homoserine phosphotransferase ThrH [Propionibacteriaceae bacterium]|jgi:phosphoserine/homoserine phosphotransferase|nr:bifunctional phosphoserine phosphatase/homoserine phosphotransferase ThrH [Propionibacteriaceae bacterium]
MAMEMVCLDLEGVLVPEVWVNVAETTGIEALRLTTREVADYDELMRHRLRILETHGLKLADLQAVIAAMEPHPGAVECLGWLERHFQVVVLSDTFYDFAAPLMVKLGFPTLFCHELEVADDGRVTGYRLRLDNQKQVAVEAFQRLNLPVFAAGDSYNDTAMLLAADLGVLFRPPQKVAQEFPQLPVTQSFDQLTAIFQEASSRRLPAFEG